MTCARFATWGFLAALFLSASLPARAQQEHLNLPRPPVLAFYYSWYGEADWADTRRMSDFPLQTYAYGDKAAIAAHVAEGLSAGLDGFIMSWYGVENNNPTTAHFHTLLEAAAAQNFRAAVHFDSGGAFNQTRETVAQNLRYLYANFLNHPAYFNYDGRPVVFFWKQERFLSPPVWAELRAEIDPQRWAVWMAEGVDPAWAEGAFDGLHLYTIAWSDDPAATLRHFAEATRARGGLWAATAMPGWDDTGLRDTRGGTFQRPRQNGGYLRQTFRAAHATQADMLLLTSYNEWLEGTAIAASRAYGDAYLRLTRRLIEALPNPAPLPLPNLPATDIFVIPSTTLKVRAGPSRGYRELGRVTAEMRLPLLARFGNWLLVRWGESDSLGWVSYDYCRVTGDMSAVPTLWWYLRP